MGEEDRLRAAIRRIVEPERLKTFASNNSSDLHPSDFAILSRSFLSPNVVGMSVGPKIVAGEENEDLCLRVYVAHKKPAHMVDFPIPSKVTLQSGETFSTDIVEIGELLPQIGVGQTEDESVLLPGLSIGHPRITAGTLGCIVQRRDVSGVFYVLSNYHVLGDDGAAPFGSAVIQPATADGGVSPLNDVAMLAYAAPFLFDATPCRVDAAIAILSNGKKWRNDWQQKGNTINVVLQTRPPIKSEKVHKIGRTSGYSTGKIIDPNMEAVKVSHKEPGGNIRKPVIFIDQVLCTKYADGGDSGSIVFGDDGYIIGLHMSGNEQVSVFNKIGNVFEELSIELPSEPKDT